MPKKPVEREETHVVPVSTTHRVQTVKADIRSALEQHMDLRQEKIKDIETALLEEALSTIDGAMKFADFDPELTEPDEAFLEKYKDHGDPQKLFRLAKFGQMKASEAPVGLQIAQKTAIGILKARAADKGEAKPLNVAIQVVSSAPVFEVQYETDDGEDK